MKRLFFTLMITLNLSGAQYIYAQCVECDLSSTTGGNYATALGQQTTSSGDASLAAGAISSAFGDASTAIGFRNIAEGDFSFAIGSFAHAAVNHSYVIGDGHSESFRLSNNTSYSLMIGFKSNKPTLFVGMSDGYGKTGSVAIGNVDNGLGFIDPQAKLHIRSDVGEEATVFIETRSWDEGIRASIGLGNVFHGITAKNSIGLQFHTQLYYTFNDGNVGINTTKPDYNLHVEGSLFTKQFKLVDEHNEPREGFVLVSDIEGYGLWADPDEFGLWSKNLNNETDIYFTDGNVGIGTIDTYGYRLTVDGKILTDEVMVTHPVTWHDYVFASDYKLITLYELEKFVQANHHLPNIPSEAQITEQGFSLGEMDGLLLKKIEELTLYIIEQEKRLDRQALEIQELKTRTSN